MVAFLFGGMLSCWLCLVDYWVEKGYGVLG